MQSKRTLAVLTLASLTSAAMAAPTVINDPAKITDGFIYQSIPVASASQLASASPGMNSSLGVGVTGGASPRAITTFIRFDLTGVTFNPATERATLTLTNIGTSFIVPPASGVTDPTVSQPVTVSLRPVLSAWNFNTISFAPGSFSFGGPPQTNAGQPTGGYGSPLADTEQVTAVGQVVTFDISSQLQSWLNTPASNFGLNIYQTSAPELVSGNWAVANFSSSRGSSVPTLRVAVIPEPTTLAALSMAGLMLVRRGRR
jgi:hypothetical protein